MSNCQCATRITLSVIVTLLISASAVVRADTRISGQVLHSGRPAAAAKLSFSCDNAYITSAIANNYGAFQISIPPGKKNCTLGVKWDNRDSERVPIDVVNGQKVLSIKLRKWKDKWLLEIR